MEKLEGISLKERLRGKRWKSMRFSTSAFRWPTLWRLRTPRHHSPRHQARQYLCVAKRADQNPRFWSGQIGARQGIGREGAGRFADRDGRDSGNGGLHVAGAGAGEELDQRSDLFSLASCSTKWPPARSRLPPQRDYHAGRGPEPEAGLSAQSESDASSRSGRHYWPAMERIAATVTRMRGAERRSAVAPEGDRIRRAETGRPTLPYRLATSTFQTSSSYPRICYWE